MDWAQNLITSAVFRKLLQELLDRRSTACLRYRLAGEMWKINFMRVVELTPQGAVFNDETISEFVHLADLSDVMQFELDARFLGYEPHFHYEVKPATDEVLAKSRKGSEEKRK